MDEEVLTEVGTADGQSTSTDAAGLSSDGSFFPDEQQT